MRQRSLVAVSFYVAGLAALGVAVACEIKSDYPPVPGEPYEAGGNSGQSTGAGGGEGAETECVHEGFMCIPEGDMSQCPELVAGDLCGSDSDGGASGLICCNLNDSGAPDVVIGG
jgi:hypothetical protein